MARNPSCTVFIGNISWEVDEQQLKDILTEVGSVKSLRLMVDKESGKPKGFGFCEFYDKNTAESAVRNLHGHEIGGRQLRVNYADEGSGAERGRDRRDRDPSHGPPAPKAAGGASAASLMASVLGGAGGAEHASMSEMSPVQLYQIMSEMKILVQQNPTAARQILVNSPQLTKALFQAQVTLGMIKAPQAPAQPIVLPGMPLGGPSAVPGLQQPPQYLPQPHQPLQPPMMPHYPPAMVVPGLIPQQPSIAPQQMGHPFPHQPPPGPPLSGQLPPQQQLQPPMQAVQQPMQAVQQPMQAVKQTMQAVQPPPAAPALTPAPGLSGSEQQALLAQLLSLTPEQIQALPATERDQAVAIIEMMRRQQQ